jgi:hypothetical protein
MSSHTFRDFYPPPRADEPYDRAEWEESATGIGDWVANATVTLDPLDPNPMEPIARDFTLESLLDPGFFRVRFLTANDEESEWSAAIQSPPAPYATGEGVPTPEEVRLRSPLLRQLYPAYEGDAELGLLLDDLAPLIGSLTCRSFAGGEGTEVPTALYPLAIQVFAMVAESRSLTGTAKARSSQIGRAGLRSITAGPWSESYFGPEEAEKAQMLWPDADVHGLLWALATQDCRDAWLALWTGTHAPAGVLVGFDYGRVQRRYGRGYRVR